MFRASPKPGNIENEESSWPSGGVSHIALLPVWFIPASRLLASQGVRPVVHTSAASGAWQVFF